jgi:hypothetical protein
MLEKTFLLKTYTLSLLSYPAGIIPIKEKHLNKLKNICNWSNQQYNNSTTYHSKMNENRLSLKRNCNPPGFNIPILKQKISSFKCKFINEL